MTTKRKIDIKNGEELVDITTYDEKGDIQSIGVYNTFWGNVSPNDERVLREIGKETSKTLEGFSPEHKLLIWKKDVQKMAPTPDIKQRVWSRYIMLGAGLTINEIKQIERFIDGN